jgi:hypothetical protein
MELKVPYVIYSPYSIPFRWHYHTLAEMTELKLLWLV